MYKRQVLGFIVKACFKGSLRVSEAEEAQGLDVAAHGESAYPAYVGPVSYTHLDVYKRQPLFYVEPHGAPAPAPETA